MRCMEKAINGDYGAPQLFEGSLAYGRTLHRFLLIFFGTKQSGLDRAQHAGFVQGFLRRARCYVYHTKGLTLKENFLPAPTYAHTLHSVQVAVLKLKAHRVFHSHLPCTWRRRAPTL